MDLAALGPAWGQTCIPTTELHVRFRGSTSQKRLSAKTAHSAKRPSSPVPVLDTAPKTGRSFRLPFGVTDVSRTSHLAGEKARLGPSADKQRTATEKGGHSFR